MQVPSLSVGHRGPSTGDAHSISKQKRARASGRAFDYRRRYDKSKGPEVCSAFSIKGIEENKHRQDALVSAVAAREGFEGRWSTDLGKKRDS